MSMPAEQIEAMLSADVAAEIPFTIQITKLAERPRHALKYNDTFLVLDNHGDIGASAGGSG